LRNAFRESISNGSFRFKVGSSNIEKSASSLRESGLEPIEELVAILNRKEVHLIDIYYKIARRLPNSIKRKLPRPLSQQSRRQNALLILGDLDEIAIPALPALKKISVDKSETQQFRKTAKWVISRIEVFEKKKSLP